MTNIKIIKQNGNILEFEVSGHSGYSESGSDIVCASISSLAQSTALGISEVQNIKSNIQINEKLPKFTFKFAKNVTVEQIESAQVLLKTFELSVKNIAEQYKKYIKLEVKNEIY